MMENNNIKRFAGFYFLLQGLLGLMWWAIIIVTPDSRNLFLPSGVPQITLLGFWLADGTFFVFGSLYCGLSLLLQKRFHAKLFWFIAGGISYAAFYCLGLSIVAKGGWLMTVVMLVAMSITVLIVSRLNE